MRLAVVAVLGLAGLACQPMYGGKPQKLKTPDPVARPVDAAGSAEPPKPKLDDNCGKDPSTPRSPRSARDLVADAEGTRRQADKLDDPEARAKQIAVSIEQYRTALGKDPYNAEATLGLALAYDALRRKGCAMKLLNRISELAKHPTYRDAAERAADEVKSNGGWFQYYRTDAERAVGR